jgi:TIR domain
MRIGGAHRARALPVRRTGTLGPGQPEDAMARIQIFISHISSESALAQALKQRMARDFLGLLDIFVSSDQSTIGAGRKWLDEVDKGLKAADLQIVLASKQSVGRPWVNFEAGAVWLRGIPVIPVCHSGLSPAQLPVPLSLLQAIALTDPLGLAKLYDAVAARLKVSTPAIDFVALATELRGVETETGAAAQAVELLAAPRILVAASAQYAQPAFGFELDVQSVQAAFPGCCTVERALTRKRLRELLTTQRFDIVHLVLPVHPESGALIFSEVHAATSLPAAGNPETLSAASFSSLLVETGARLVVLATCRALLLAVEVAPVANMAASDADITGEQAKEWCDCFYGLLAQGRSVHKSFELTRSQIELPIRAIRQKDVAFAPVAR